MSAVQAAAATSGPVRTSTTKSYRGRPRVTPKETQAGLARIPYSFNPVPVELHRPAYLRPILQYSDKVIEQALCAMTCAEGRPPEGIIRSISAISQWTGTSLRTVSRSINRLRAAGVIETIRVPVRTKGDASPWCRYVYRIKLPSMTGPCADPGSAQGESSFHDTVSCHNGMPSSREACIEECTHQPTEYVQPEFSGNGDETKDIRLQKPPIAQHSIQQTTEAQIAVTSVGGTDTADVKSKSVSTCKLEKIPAETSKLPALPINPETKQIDASKWEKVSSEAENHPMMPADQNRLQDRLIKHGDDQVVKPVDLATQSSPLAEKLRGLGVWQHAIKRIFSLRTSEEIIGGLQTLSEQIDVLRPGAWLYAHLVNHWDAIQEAKNADPLLLIAEAQLAQAREFRPPQRLTGAELNKARDASREREAQQAREDKLKLAKQTDLEAKAVLGSLPPELYDALYAQAKAQFRGRQVPQAAVIGGMLGILDQRALAARPHTQKTPGR